MKTEDKILFEAGYEADRAEESEYSLEELLISRLICEFIGSVLTEGPDRDAAERKADEIQKDGTKLFQIMVQYLPASIEAAARDSVSKVMKAYLDGGRSLKAAEREAKKAVQGYPRNQKTPGEE